MKIALCVLNRRIGERISLSAPDKVEKAYVVHLPFFYSFITKFPISTRSWLLLLLLLLFVLCYCWRWLKVAVLLWNVFLSILSSPFNLLYMSNYNYEEERCFFLSLSLSLFISFLSVWSVWHVIDHTHKQHSHLNSATLDYVG